MSDYSIYGLHLFRVVRGISEKTGDDQPEEIVSEGNLGFGGPEHNRPGLGK